MSLLQRARFQPEAELIENLFERFQLEGIIRHYEGKEAGAYYEYVMSSQLRLTPVIAPRLCALLDEVTDRLGFDENVELYVQSDSSINAGALHALGEGTPHVITITSGMVERMTDDEVRFILGHECGHLAYRHYRANLAFHALGANREDSKMPRLLGVRLSSWNRLAELSADRAGLAAVGGNLDVAVSTFFKLQSGLGPEHLKFDIRGFIDQLESLANMRRKDIVRAFSHPMTPVRVRALQLFTEGGGTNASADQIRAIDAEVSELTALLEYEVSDADEVHVRDFLVSAGLLAAHADGSPIDEDQRTLLTNLILPLSGDPEAHFTRIDGAEEAEAMMLEAGTWLSEHSGEERFAIFAHLAHVVALDGHLHPGEQQFMMRAAKLLGIPEKRAQEICYEVLAGYLQSQVPTSGTFGFR